MSNVRPPAGSRRADAWGVAAIGIYQVVLSLVLLGLLFALWPERPSKDAGWLPDLQLGSWQGKVGDDARLILIVLCTGALGSHVHAATSFATFVGNRQLNLSWAWWYVLRPFIGMALALIFYFVVRGGLLSTGAAPSDISVFGVASVAGLVGMFSKQATDKLRELFDNLFRTEQGEGDDARADKLAASLPVSKAMIPRNRMSAYVIGEDRTTADVRLLELHRLLGGLVTRVPVLDSADVALCIIHQSLLYKYLADRSIETILTGKAFDPSQYTLEEFLGAPGMAALVQESIAYVKLEAPLSDAKAGMDAVPTCQDVLVTRNGAAGEAVLGWLTDGDLRRAARIA